jgi:AraC family transcriptional regulator
MDWIERLNAVMDYIEANLDGEISQGKIASLALCSSYNFQRMFSYISDRPLMDYIRARRLTFAAFDLMNGRERVVDLAVKYGYDSVDAFSRAFQRFHGVAPSRVRSEVVALRSCPRLSFQISVGGTREMRYQIEQWPAFTVTGFWNGVPEEKAFEVVPGLWADAFQNGRMARLFELCARADQRPSGIIGCYMAGEAQDESGYLMGVTTHVDAPGCADIPAPEGLVQRYFPAAMWAIINADGPLPDAVQSIYKQFYAQWLPGSGYEPVDLPVIECYMQDDRQEVWIAVRKPR